MSTRDALVSRRLLLGGSLSVALVGGLTACNSSASTQSTPAAASASTAAFP